ncbi:MAG: ComEC/Rec2 family competence protein [bacterium]|nr:ComEC/Rec2 family competence protein [bacterium]
MHPSRIFFYSCSAFGVGICVSAIFRIPESMTLGMLGIATASLAVAVLTKVRIKYLVPALGIIAFALGIIRLGDVEQRWEHERNEFLLAAQNLSRVFPREAPSGITATVASRERLENSTRYELERISLEDRSRTRWLLTYTGYEIFDPGDRILLQRPHFDTSTTSEAFLKRDGIAGAVRFPEKIVPLGSSCPTFLANASCARYRASEQLSHLKESFEKNLRLALPVPHAALAAGLLLGTRSALSQEMKDDFRRTGMSHIVAVSGYNITILILAIATLMGFFMLPRSLTFWAVTLFIILFTLLTGAGASVVRAALMGFLLILAQKESRMYSARIALSSAGALMLFQNPMLLRYDLGFVLSFLATAGLLVLYPLLEERARENKKLSGIKDVALQSVSAQLFVLPVIIITFGSISFVFLISNVAVLPFIPPTMFFSFLAGIAGFFGEHIGNIVAFPAYILLDYEIIIVATFSKIPHASLALASASLRYAAGLASTIGAALLVWKLKKLRETF